MTYYFCPGFHICKIWEAIVQILWIFPSGSSLDNSSSAFLDDQNISKLVFSLFTPSPTRYIRRVKFELKYQYINNWYLILNIDI